MKELSCDSSSFQVRAAVIHGMNHVIKHCPRSHVYMRQVLAKVNQRFFDVKDSVRSAFMDLLATVKGLKLINFWDIVSVDEILSQLEVETSSTVCYKIVGILLRSFFPPDEEHEGDEDNTKVKRCIYLIKQNRAASRKFYRVSQYAPFSLEKALG